MNLSQLKKIYERAGTTRLYAKVLAENDNSKNQIYFAGTIEALNTFPSKQIFNAENTKKGPSFKAELDFYWLTESGLATHAPHSKFILYSQYPEIRFSGFLKGCKAGPSELMRDRQRAEKQTSEQRSALVERVFFIGITGERKLLGYVAAGNSQIAREFKSRKFEDELGVFVVAPRKAPVEQVKEYVRAKGRWIAKQQRAFEAFHPKPKPRKYVSGESHWYLGRQYMLKISKTPNSEEVKLTGPHLHVTTNNLRNKAGVKASVKQWYTERARARFQERLAICAESAGKHGLKPHGLVVRWMTKRWGSCMKDGRIILNPELVKAPTACIDYVIFHELCHLKHHNHGKGFYRLLERLMPDWQKWKDRLEKAEM